MKYFELISMALFCVFCGKTSGQIFYEKHPPIRSSIGQHYPMPAFDLNRINDSVYVKSMVNMTHDLLLKQNKLPASPIRDTTILRLYNYLGTLYRETKTYSDSALFYGKKMVAFAQKSKIMEFEVKGLIQQATYYRTIKRNREEALRLNLKAYNIVINADHDPQVLWRICYNLGDLYKGINEYDKALKYFQQSEELIKDGTGLSNLSTDSYILAILQGIGNIYVELNNLKFAENYFSRIFEKLKNVPIKTSHAYIYNDFAVLLVKLGKINDAIEFNKKAEEFWIGFKNFEELSYTKSLIALNYLKLNDLKLAKQYAKEIFALEKISLTGQENAYLVLYKINLINRNWAESLSNYEKHIAIRDSLTSKVRKEELYKIQSRFDFENLELRNKQLKELQDKEIITLTQKNELEKIKSLAEKQRYLDNLIRQKLKSEIEAQKLKEKDEIINKKNHDEIINKEKLINALKINKLEQEKTNESRKRNTLWIGLTSSIILGSILFLYNYLLRKQNKELNLKNKIIENVNNKIQNLEISALRSQMNPHFIFNCLNSIQLFVAQNNPEKASEYLTKFSKLIRLVLENSRTDKISLENELKTLQLYIEMESMRFKGKINSHFSISKNIDTGIIQIPPLLIQPFVENAIWHGLMHKEEGGNLSIKISEKNKSSIKIEITDNGVGREKANESKSKSVTKNKSFGMKVTSERINLINQIYKTNTDVEVFDLKNQNNEASGTKVIITIPII